MATRIFTALAAVLFFSSSISFAHSKMDLIQSHLNPPKVADGQHLNYYGGPVLSSVKLYAVYWGPNVSQTTRQGIGGFYAAITKSSQFDWLSEYKTTIKAIDGRDGTNQQINQGSFGGEYMITPTHTSTTLSNEDIAAELVSQIEAGNLPKSDANSMYVIDFPPGVTITLTDGGSTATSCQQFCAYHNSTKDHAGHDVVFGVIPELTDGGCAFGCGANNNPFDNTTLVSSHEIVEATTDPLVGGVETVQYPLGWMDPNPNNGEIGDICVGQQDSFTAATGVAYVLQKEWSNQSNLCLGMTR